MRQVRLHSWFRPRGLTPLFIASVSALAFLVPATLGASTASAAPSPGYTATLIPTGQESDAVAVDPDTDTAYFVDLTTADELTVVDGDTDAVTGTIGLPEEPRGVAVDPATDTVYASMIATSSSPPEIAVIDGATGTVTATIALPATSSPYGVAVDSSTNTVYVAEEGAAAVAVIDGSTDTVTATVSTGGTPIELAVDETTDVIWVADRLGNVLAISGTSNALTQTISLSGAIIATDVAVDPATDTVYAATQSGGIAVIDGATGTVSTTIDINGTFGVAVDSGSGTVFASTYQGASGSGTTWVIDEATQSVTDTIERGGFQIATDTATGTALVAPYAAEKSAAWVLTPSAANAMSPVITSTAATFTVGTAGSFAISGSALPAAVYSETGTLPGGVTLSSAGTLSGTPAAGSGGVYPITITASNGIAPDFSRAFTLTVDQAASVALPAAVTLQVGVPASIPVQVTGYPAPQLFVDIAPPQWLLLSQLPSGSWELSGTPPPASGGEYEVSFQAQNSGGFSVPAVMVITVQEAPSFASAATTTFETDRVNTYNVGGGCVPGCTYSGTGLPSGVTLDSSGLLSGDAAAGTYALTITASNSLGTATLNLTLIVQESIALGVETFGLQLFVQAWPVLPPGWVSLQGVLSAAPAVAAVPTPGATTPVAPLFLATGSNGELWMYSVSGGWQAVGPSEAFCIGSPAAVVAGSTLTVACEGLNRQLYYNTATLPASGIPSFTGPWISLGGILSAGPAVAPVGGVLTFFAEGTNGQVFTNTGSGYTATPWFCIGNLAAATDASTGITTFACQGQGDHSLWTATSPGTGWSAAQSLGGQLIGGPGIAAASGITDFLVEGTDGSVWEWTAASGWTTFLGTSGAVMYGMGGVGAVALN